jgi:glycosyltransferase involved in cell wall biosynthesis
MSLHSSKKHILYINQYFKHPSEPGITRSYWIAKELIKNGYRVTMLAHRNLSHKHIKKALPVEIEDVDGIRVIYIRNAYSNEMSIPARAWSFLKFMFKSIRYALNEKNVDLVISTSTPLTVAVPALLRKFLKKTRYVFEVRDLWPEVPIQMGAIRSSLMIKLLRKFEELTYKQADHVIALSPGMQDGVVKYIPFEKTTMIPNMAKIDQFWPRPSNTDLIRNLKLKENSFKVIYFGQLGESNAIEYILKAIDLFNKSRNKDVEFIFIGHGRYYKVISEYIKSTKCDNVHLFERKPMSEISEIVNFCDISLVTFSNIPILATNSPNKLFDSLSAGKPIIVNSPGWTKEMVERYECGIFVDPNRPESLVSNIIKLKNDEELRNKMSINARALAENQYDKSILCNKFVKVIDDVL